MDDEHCEDDAEDDCRQGAEDDSPALLMLGQRAAGEGDDNGVVAAQQDIDPDDLEQGDPELGVEDQGQRVLLGWIVRLNGRCGAARRSPYVRACERQRDSGS
jgi:hypothetical protein